MTKAGVFCALLLWPCLGLAAAESWSQSIDGLRVAGPDRAYESVRLVPPAMGSDTHVVRVHWRYTLPSGRRLLAWLCAGHHCVRLQGRRGVSDGLAGTADTTPLYLRFRLPAGIRQPVRVGSIQLLVDCR